MLVLLFVILISLADIPHLVHPALYPSWPNLANVISGLTYCVIVRHTPQTSSEISSQTFLTPRLVTGSQKHDLGAPAGIVASFISPTDVCT